MRTLGHDYAFQPPGMLANPLLSIAKVSWNGNAGLVGSWRPERSGLAGFYPVFDRAALVTAPRWRDEGAVAVKVDGESVNLVDSHTVLWRWD